MIKKILLSLLLSAGTLYADIAGGELSLGIFSHAPDGSASYTLPYIGAGTSADVEHVLHWDEETDIVLKAYIEHPVPMLPNIKLAFSDLSHEGAGPVTDFTWGSIDIPLGNIQSSMNLQMYDLTLYYELLDNWAEVDAGVTLRYFDGDISVRTAVLGEGTDFDLFVPMLYAKARFNIPATDISLQAEANAISYDDSTLYDYELAIRYTLAMGLGVEGGYRAIHVDSEDLADGLVADMDFSGFFVSAIWDF
jgi:outer membrane protein